MVYGTEIDETVTKHMVEEGYYPPGTLLSMEGQVFMVLGYNFWGGLHDCADSDVFYDIMLHHVGTGFVSSFPLLMVSELATVITKEEK